MTSKIQYHCIIHYSLEADSLYRAQLERYAASLAVASSNPSIGLGTATALSSYSMLAAGYSPSALGFVPPSHIIPPPLPETLGPGASAPLRLSSLSSRNVNSPQRVSLTQHLSSSLPSDAQISLSTSSTSESKAVPVTTSSSVLHQRLSNTNEVDLEKDSGRQLQMDLQDPKTLPSSSSQSNYEITIDGSECRKEKKKPKSGHNNRGKMIGKWNIYADIFISIK